MANFLQTNRDFNDRNVSKSVTVLENNHGSVAQFVDIYMINDVFTEEYSTAQAGTTIITPPSGYRVCVRFVETATQASTGKISVDFATSGLKVHRHYVNTQGRGETVSAHIVGAVDEPLSLTTTTGTNDVFVVVVYVFHL